MVCVVSASSLEEEEEKTNGEAITEVLIDRFFLLSKLLHTRVLSKHTYDIDRTNGAGMPSEIDCRLI